MLVDGNTPQTLSSSTSSFSTTVSPKLKLPVQTKEPAQKAPLTIKLPAKKRPYIEKIEDTPEPIEGAKRQRTEHDKLTKEIKSHPLSSLQQMHLNLDEYLMR